MKRRDFVTGALALSAAPAYARPAISFHDAPRMRLSPPFIDGTGRELTLADFRGQVVLVNVWATWCGPCLKAMPDLEEVHREFAERGVVVVALNLGEDPERARSFIKRQGYTFRVVADQDRPIAERFGVRAIPTLVVVGTVTRKHVIANGCAQM